MFAAASRILKQEGPALEAIHRLFAYYQEMAVDNKPLGCLIANSQGQFLKSDTDLTEILSGQMGVLTRSLESAIKRGKKQGDIDPGLNARTTARMLAALATGILVGMRTWMSAAYVKDINLAISYLLRREE